MSGGATFLIGFIPSYATIGVAAPILLLLLRVTQSFSASGEYAGAGTFVAEYAPAAKRGGLLTSVVPIAAAAGFLVASLMATVLYASTSPEFMQEWGLEDPVPDRRPAGYRWPLAAHATGRHPPAIPQGAGTREEAAQDSGRPTSGHKPLVRNPQEPSVDVQSTARYVTQCRRLLPAAQLHAIIPDRRSRDERSHSDAGGHDRTRRAHHFHPPWRPASPTGSAANGP